MLSSVSQIAGSYPALRLVAVLRGDMASTVMAVINTYVHVHVGPHVNTHAGTHDNAPVSQVPMPKKKIHVVKLTAG